MEQGSRRRLDAFFAPKAVAVIGASEEPGRIGSGLVRSIQNGFSGAVYCVNPKYKTLFGGPCYASVQQLPEKPTHAVVAVVSSRVPAIVHECAQAGIENVVVISAGFKESGERGAQLEREMTAFCNEQGIMLLGPNTLGFINTQIEYNGTFLPNRLEAGCISVISQSGGVGMALISSLQEQRCGLAKWVGIGNEAVLDAVQLLQYLAEDAQTKAIAVCFEGLKDLPGFLQLARTVNRTKPVVVLRDGNSPVGMQAAISHTGAMAQSPGMMRDLIRQHGLLEADTCRDCAVMLKALAIAPRAAGSRVAILTNTAGPSILAADAMEPLGVRLPQPTQPLRDEIDKLAGAAMQLKNPADISSNGLNPTRYGVAAQALLGSAEYDALLGFFSLNAHLILPDAQLIAARQATQKPVVGCFLSSVFEFAQYDGAAERQGIPCFCDPHDAAVAMAAIVRHHQYQTDVPPDMPPLANRTEIAAVLAQFPAAAMLPEAAAQQVLQLAGVQTAAPQLARSEDHAVTLAASAGYPVVLKLHSAVLTHKSEVGGVWLDLRDEAALRNAYRNMLPRMQALDSDAALTVQPMLPPGFEVILGAVRVPGVGPILMAGSGGIYSEVLDDHVFRLGPIGRAEASAMLASLRCARILDGYRGPALDKVALAEALCGLSSLLQAFPRISEIDINPCRAYPDRAVALDARIALQAP